MTLKEKIEQYKEDFDLFETPNEKLEYIFDLGKKHTTLPQDQKNDDTFVVGCASAAWLTYECKNGQLILKGEGTSEIAKGMLGLFLDIFSENTPDEILNFDPNELNQLGILELLSPVRQKSLEAFLNKVYDYAKRCKENK